MQRFSEDLRWRVVFLTWDGLSQRQVATMLRMSQSMVAKILKLYNNTGLVTRSLTRTTTSVLRPEDYYVLYRSVLDDPMSPISDHMTVVNAFREDSALRGVSLSTVFRSMKLIGFTRKKVTRLAQECQIQNQFAFMNSLRNLGVRANMCVWVDETSTDKRTTNRRYGYALLGMRCCARGFFVRGKRYSTAAALWEGGLVGYHTLEDSFDGPDFYKFVEQYVVPSLTPFPGDRSVLILDGASIHNQGALEALVESVGARLLILPPYSPDFDPVEHLFSKIKGHIRSWGSSLIKNGLTIPDVLDMCFDAVTAKDCHGWVRNCGSPNETFGLL